MTVEQLMNSDNEMKQHSPKFSQTMNNSVSQQAYYTDKRSITNTLKKNKQKQMIIKQITTQIIKSILHTITTKAKIKLVHSKLL